jgi:GH35 family endo-1,4-beta-xylanase
MSGAGDRMKTIAKNTTVVAIKDQVSCNLDQEAVVLHLGKGMYYGLNQVGATIWNALQQPRKVEEIHRLILAEYEVEPAPSERDLLRLLQDLAEAGLIEVKDG